MFFAIGMLVGVYSLLVSYGPRVVFGTTSVPMNKMHEHFKTNFDRKI